MIKKDEKEKSIEVINLSKFLESIIQSPKKYLDDSSVKTVLKSQGALAKFENKNIGIIGSSLNTLKKRADEYLDGGFDVLDRLRMSALQNIEDYQQRDKKPNKKTRAGLAKCVNDLEKDVLKMQKISFRLLQGITEAISETKSIANIDDREVRQNRAEQAVKKLRLLLMTNPQPFDGVIHLDNIVDIGKKIV